MFEDDPGFMPDYNAPISLGEQFQALQGLGTQAVNFVSGAVRMVPGFLGQLRQDIKTEAQAPLKPKTPTVASPVVSGVQSTLGLAETQAKTEAQLMNLAATGVERAGQMFGINVPASVSGAAALLVGAVLPGPGEGISFAKGSASFGKQFISRSREVEKLSSKITEYRAIGKTSRIGKTEAKLSSAQSNVLPFTPEDPRAYPANLVAAKEIVTAEKLKRGTADMLHLHHKLPKGMSAAFFDRMDQFISKGVASPDDLADMADEATKAGVRTGDARSNILAIADRPHTELHTEMRAMGSGMFGRMELGKKELMAAMKEAKDPTSLKALWKAWLTDDAKYLVETAEVWEPLDALLKEVRNMK